MKSKKLIVFLSSLVFLTVLIVLNSTIFTLQKVSVNWLTTKYELTYIKDYDIIDNVSLGDSIFLVNKEGVASLLEKKYPYLRVVSIETKFPNHIVVHSAERENLYAVKLSDNEYAVIDELGKVLNISNSTIFAGSELGAKPIRVIFNSLPLSVKDFVIGQTAAVDSVVELLTQLSYTLRESNYSPTNSKGVFLSIEITATGTGNEVRMTTRNGMIICLKEAGNLTTEKFLLALERYNYYHQEGVVSGTIEVWYNRAVDKIVARYL